MTTEAIDATQTARNASCVSLAQYIVAVNAGNFDEGSSRDSFAVVQQLASLILIDALRNYEYVNIPNIPDAAPDARPPVTPIKRKGA